MSTQFSPKVSRNLQKQVQILIKKNYIQDVAEYENRSKIAKNETKQIQITKRKHTILFLILLIFIAFQLVFFTLTFNNYFNFQTKNEEPKKIVNKQIVERAHGNKRTLLASYESPDGRQEWKTSGKLDNVTVVFTNKQRYHLTYKCLRSFFIYNSYPAVTKIIIVEDGLMNPELKKLMEVYKNITWLVTEKNVGQVVAIDMAYEQIQTQYYLHCETDNIFLRSGFIQESLRILKIDPDVGSAVLRSWDGLEIENFTIYSGFTCGFTFHPSMHRLSDYKKFKGGYTGISQNFSYGAGVGQSQFTVRYHYYLIGKHMYFLMEYFTIHIGGAEGQSRVSYDPKTLQRDYNTLTPKQKAALQIEKDRKDIIQKRNALMTDKRIYFQKGVKMNNFEGNNINNREIQNMGIGKQIQIGSQFDYLNILSTQYYRQYKYYFDSMMQLNVRTDYTYYHTIVLESYQQRTQALKKKDDARLRQSSLQKLMSQRILSHPDNNTLSRAAVHLFSIKNKIIEYDDPVNLCLVIEGTAKQYKDQKFTRLMDSIKRQSYGRQYSLNFILSSQQQNYVQDKVRSLNLYSRVSYINFVNNHKKYSAPGLFIFKKALCRKNNIIVELRPTDQFIGVLAFQIIFKAYEINKQMMFATFKSVSRDSSPKQLVNLDKNIIGQFRTKNQADLSPFLKTYRHKITLPLIFEYLSEFVYDQKSQAFHPNFYPTNSDVFHVYSLIELAGKDRTKFFEDIMIARQPRDQNATNEKCWKQKEDWIGSKSKLKTPLKKLKTMLRPYQIEKPYQVSQAVQQKVKNSYKKYQECLKR